MTRVARVFHGVAAVMVTGGIIGAGHGAACGWEEYLRSVPPNLRTKHDVLNTVGAFALLHAGPAMFLAPLAPIFLTQQLWRYNDWTSCPTMTTAKNAVKSLVAK